jgi:hypothetical protein
MSGVTIDNQSDFAVVFRSFSDVSNFWDGHILRPIDKQYFSDESFFCGTHSVMVALKQLLDHDGSYVESSVL